MLVKLFRNIDNLQKLIDLYKQNLTASELSRYFNCHHTSILHNIKKYNITRDESRTIEQIITKPTKFQKEQIYNRPKLRMTPKKAKPIYGYKSHYKKLEKSYKEILESKGLRLKNVGCYGLIAVKIKQK